MDPLKELEGLDAGRVLALVKKVGGRKSVDAVLRGEKKITLEDIIRLLVDKNRRCIPYDLQSSVCDPDTDFHLVQQEIDCRERLERFENGWQLKKNKSITVAEFEDRSGKIRELVLANKQIANLEKKGIGLPFFIPQTNINPNNPGKAMEEFFLPAVERAYLAQFPNRSFNNNRKGELDGEVGIIQQSLQGVLIDALSKGSVVGRIYPTCLQGFSINADRENMKNLVDTPTILSGFDFFAALVGYQDILARDYKTPGYDLAAFSWQSAAYSMYCEARDDGFDFGRTDDLADAYDNYSGGLAVLG